MPDSPKLDEARKHTYKVFWSDEDQEYVATVEEFTSLSCLEPDPAQALEGLIGVVAVVLEELASDKELSKANALWEACEDWVKTRVVLCPESIYQCDHVQEGLHDLAVLICGYVGYYEGKDDDG